MTEGERRYMTYNDTVNQIIPYLQLVGMFE